MAKIQDKLYNRIIEGKLLELSDEEISNLGLAKASDIEPCKVQSQRVSVGSDLSKEFDVNGAKLVIISAGKYAGTPKFGTIFLPTFSVGGVFLSQSISVTISGPSVTLLTATISNGATPPMMKPKLTVNNFDEGVSEFDLIIIY